MEFINLLFVQGTISLSRKDLAFSKLSGDGEYTEKVERESIANVGIYVKFVKYRKLLTEILHF